MNPPANWYPDPTGRHDQRYWDGEQWTEHVFTDGVQGVDPLEQATADADAAASGGDDPAGEHEEHEEHEEQSEPTAHGDESAADTADSDAGGLFTDAGGEEAWSPGEEEPEGATTVAADVEAEDVVATLDEVADASPPDTADAPDTTDAPDTPDTADTPGESTATAEDAPPTAGDMSDAFILAPETASRIVKRRAEQAGEEDGEHQPAAEDVGPQGVDDVTEPEHAPPTATDGEAGPGDPGEGGLGISGDLLGGAFAERSGAEPVALQNSRLLRCSVTPGAAVVARQGTMVAYQGDVSFERQGAGGVTRALKRAATGEGLAMMRTEGSGDVFFADGGQHVFLLQLAGGPGLSVNGRNVLAFSAALQWDIQRVKGASLLAGGLFNTTFTGNGWVALVSDGEPVVLHTEEAPTHVDVNALVAWSAGLSTRIVNSVSAKSLVGLGSGEAFQMAFDGAGVVIVQPSEGPLGGAAAT